MKFSLSTILFLLASCLCFGQVPEDFSQNQEKAPGPQIGVGVGVIGFYGDLNDNEYGSPFTSNIGFNLYLLQPINDFLNLKLGFLRAEIIEEERSLERNLNFKSDIFAGSAMVEYNFDHFLPKKRTITPFVTAGVEVFEYDPKSDLKDFSGNSYFYWTDGTIRNIDEMAPDAGQSVIIQRDFSYETDIREAGLNGTRTFLETTFSIPVGIGFTMHLNDQFDFRLESIMHFAFTDDIDGISNKTSRDITQNKRANGRNDFFYFNSFTLSYNFQKVEGAGPNERKLKDEPVDYLATGNTEDFDNDGIIDLVDLCPNTPKGIAVDTLGCPVDSDGDKVPDYKDEEVNTEYPEFANDKGVEVTDEMIYRSYMRYKDSTLEFAETIERDFSKRGNRRSAKRYRVKVGEYQKGETPKDMSRLLSLADLSKVDQDDKTLYTVGSYKTAGEASVRAQSLQKDGFEDAEVIRKNNKGKYESTESTPLTTPPSTSTPTSSTSGSSTQDPAPVKPLVFRVQLGAFKAKPVGEKFTKIPSLFIIEANGFYRYMSGSFDNFGDAAKHKVQMVVDGFKGAFVVAYKDGKRVSLKSVGVQSLDSDPIIGK